jgi:hypothetical protein
LPRAWCWRCAVALVLADPSQVANISGTAKTLAQMQTDGYESGSTTGDPLFAGIGANPYSLQSGSPLKSSGQALSLVSDVVKVSRGTNHSIGAYE